MLNIPDIILRIFFLFFFCLFPYLFIHSFALLENDLVPDGHITITVILKFFSWEFEPFDEIFFFDISRQFHQLHIFECMHHQNYQNELNCKKLQHVDRGRSVFFVIVSIICSFCIM